MKIEEEIKSKFRNENQKALVNLHYTNLVLGNSMNQILKELDVSLQQFNVLRILRGQYPMSASIGLIKERMLDQNSDVSRIIDRLKQKKLVSRKECKSDRRQKDVLISTAGLELLNSFDQQEIEMDSLTKGLDENELKNLNNLLDKLRSGIKNEK